MKLIVLNLNDAENSDETCRCVLIYGWFKFGLLPAAFGGQRTAAVSPAGVLFHTTFEKFSSSQISCGSVLNEKFYFVKKKIIIYILYK